MSLSPSLITGGIAVVGLLLLVLTIVPTIIFIILVVANRAEPDPTGKRPMAAFLFGGSFLTLILLGLGSFGVVHGLTDLIGRHSDTFGYAKVPSNDSIIRSVVMGLLLFVIAGVAHVLHRRRGLALADSESDAGSAVRRLARSYVAAVSFLSVVIFVLTLFVFANSILQLIAPGIFQAMGSRTDTVRTLLNEAYILIFTALAFRSHQNLAPAALRLFAGRASTESASE
jgi:uncharacterized membrane protein (UPF0136 family)